jgi:PAS domain S-box-containing protein
MAQQIHALLIEDDPDDILLLKDSLDEVGLGRIKLDTADRLSRGLIQLGTQNYDVLLLDLNLPDSRGLDTLTTTVKRFPRLPVVVLSGLADDAITVEAVRRGAQDYLVKGDISGPLVLRVVRYAIERKQVEAVLRASEARYRTLVETSPNGITLADLEGRLLLCNQQAARMHGFANPEAMLGGDFFKLVALPERRFAALNTQKALNENRVTHAEFTLLRRDGSQFPADISTAVLRNSAGAATGFICITRDVTERKKADDAEKQLVMLEKEFISSVSSDLRTPLLSLMSNLDLLEKGEVKDELIQSEFLKHASSDANNLLDTVEELLDFSLLQGESLILNLEKVDLASQISEVLQSLQEKAAARRVTFLAAPMDVLITDVDQKRIRRVLVKLLENAIRFSAKGDTVLVIAKNLNDKIIINVIDEGGGISVEDSARLFEKYFKLSLSTDQIDYGMGLGLYVSKEIVKAHGGSLSISSQLKAGSTFTMSLPVNGKKERKA